MSVASKIAPMVINGKQQYDKLPLIIYELNSKISFIHGMNLLQSLEILSYNLTDIISNVTNTSSLLPPIKNAVVIADRAIEDSIDLPANISITHSSVVKGVTYIENGLTELTKAYYSMSLLTTALSGNSTFINHINIYNNLAGLRNYAEKVMTQVGDDMNKASSSYAKVIQTLSAMHEVEKEAEALLINTESFSKSDENTSDTVVDAATPEEFNIATSGNIIADLVNNATVNATSSEKSVDDSIISTQGDEQSESTVYLPSTSNEDVVHEHTNHTESVVIEQEGN